MDTYSIKVALRGVPPMIWCRLRVHGNTLLADLHHIIQIAMGWDNEYLHCLHIYGEGYGIAYEDELSFSHNARQVFLNDPGFDVGDRFTYTYTCNFTTNRLCDILSLAKYQFPQESNNLTLANLPRLYYPSSS